jgi:hypothetical protein
MAQRALVANEATTTEIGDNFFCFMRHSQSVHLTTAALSRIGHSTNKQPYCQVQLTDDELYSHGGAYQTTRRRVCCPTQSLVAVHSKRSLKGSCAQHCRNCKGVVLVWLASPMHGYEPDSLWRLEPTRFQTSPHSLVGTTWLGTVHRAEGSDPHRRSRAIVSCAPKVCGALEKRLPHRIGPLPCSHHHRLQQARS